MPNNILPDNTIEVNQEIKEITIYSNDIVGNFIRLDDPRLSDDRFPLNHNFTHFASGSDPISPSDIGAQPYGNYITPPVIFTELSDDTDESINVTKRLAKAWINFNGTGNIFIRNSFNISSVIDNGVGDYTINFLQPFSNTSYSFVAWSRDWNSDNLIFSDLAGKSNSFKTTSSIRLINNNPNNGFNYDSPECNVIFFGV